MYLGDFNTPKEVLKALVINIKIKKWHKYICEQYVPESRPLLLLYPCAENKPFTEGKTNSKSYIKLYKTLKTTELQVKTSLNTISEPLGIVGEIDYDNMPLYDCPGLFKGYVSRRNLEWSESAFNSCIRILSDIVFKFLKRNKNKFIYRLAVVMPGSPHSDIVRLAIEKIDFPLEFFPSREDLQLITSKKYQILDPKFHELLQNRLEIIKNAWL